MDPGILRRPVQIAYGVRDVVRAAETFTQQTGAGPFFVSAHIPLASARVFGKTAEFDHSSAYGQWGDVMVELVEEHTQPIVEPGSGIHHIAFFVEDTSSAVDACAAGGWPEALWAETAGGMAFAFCDARRDLGHLVEVYQPVARLRAFYRMVADAAVDWDGRDAVRMLT